MSKLTQDTNTKYGKSFYRMFSGNEDKKIGEFNIMSLSEFEANENIYDGKIVIIGTLYIGMGHFIALCYIPKTDNFVFCNEGGSNGYDRDEKYRYIMSDTFTPHLYQIVDITDNDVDSIKSNNTSIIEFADNKKQYTYGCIMKILENIIYDF